MTKKPVKRPRIPTPEPRKMSVADAASEAICELVSLAEEMRSWADSLEERFSGTDKYSRVSEAADTLENVQEPDYPEELAEVEVTIQDQKPRRKGYSRSDRCGHACYMLDECISALEQFVSDSNAGGESNAIEVDTDTADTLRDELETIKSECEGVEFPGMHG